LSIRTVFILINILSTLLASYAWFHAWRRLKNKSLAATFFILCMAATTLYAFGYTMELASNTLSQILFWVKIEHLGIEFISPTWLLFTLCLSGNEKKISPKKISLFFIIPLLMILLVITNHYHLNPRLTENAPFPTLTYTRGTVAWIGISYAAFCLVLSLFLFASMYVHSTPTFQNQALVFSLISLFPLIGMILTATNESLYHLDLAPLSMSISGIFVIIGFRRLRILDIMPLARDVIFNGMEDCVLVFDNDDQLIDYNPQAKRAFPEIKDKSIGLFVTAIFGENSFVTEMIKQDSIKKNNLLIKREGVIYRCQMQKLYDSRNKYVGKIITMQDYTETERMLKQLKKLATMDFLTNVYNRRYFFELAEKEIVRSKRLKKELSLILFDLDEFKLINDTLGHAAGDEVLKSVTALVSQRLRKYDIFGRFGGDEFLILLPETSLAQANILAEGLKSILENAEIPYKERIITITASFGVANTSFHQAQSLDELLQRADKAIYLAKENGRNCVSIDTTNRVSISNH